MYGNFNLDFICVKSYKGHQAVEVRQWLAHKVADKVIFDPRTIVACTVMHWQLAHLLSLLEKELVVLHNIVRDMKVIKGSPY